jgi:hypothetical protein
MAGHDHEPVALNPGLGMVAYKSVVPLACSFGLAGVHATPDSPILSPARQAPMGTPAHDVAPRVARANPGLPDGRSRDERMGEGQKTAAD